jgi:hypothetical protein
MALPAVAAGMPSVSDDRAAATWQRRVGERFSVFGAATPVQLALQRVDVHPASCAQTEQYSLVFEVQGPALADGAQVLQQAGTPPRALYLVQGGTAEGGAPLLRADCCHLS